MSTMLTQDNLNAMISTQIQMLKKDIYPSRRGIV